MTTPDLKSTRFGLSRFESRGAFPPVAFFWLALTLVLGVFLADPLIGGLRVFVEPLAGLFGLADRIAPDGKGGWLLPRTLTLDGGASANVTLVLDAPTLRLRLRGLPIFVALMLAPPWSPVGATPLWSRFCTGLVCMVGVFIVSVLVSMHFLGLIAAQQAAGMAQTLGASADGPAAQADGGFFPRLINHVAVFVLPILAPVLLWVWLKPEGLRLLLGRAPLPPAADAP